MLVTKLLKSLLESKLIFLFQSSWVTKPSLLKSNNLNNYWLCCYVISLDINWHAVHTSSSFRTYLVGPTKLQNYLNDFYVLSQWLWTHSLTNFKAKLYYRLNDFILLVKNPVADILIKCEFFSEAFVLSNYLEANDLSKPVVDLFIWLDSKCSPRV